MDIFPKNNFSLKESQSGAYSTSLYMAVSYSYHWHTIRKSNFLLRFIAIWLVKICSALSIYVLGDLLV